MQQIQEFMDTYFRRMPDISWTDIVEIIILSFLMYNVLLWVKNSKAWSLLKGIVVIAVFWLIAAIFSMDTILWIAEKLVGIASTVIIVILQPELRKAMEELGRKNLIASILPFDQGKPDAGLFCFARHMSVVDQRRKDGFFTLYIIGDSTQTKLCNSNLSYQSAKGSGCP